MITSILRTLVPALWALLIGKALVLVPALEPLRADLLAYGDLLAVFLSVALIGAWYAFWRWLEPRLPDWLTRAVLGSAKTPTYPPAPVTEPQVEDGELTADYHDVDRPKHSAE